jgi:hypothetical protein
MWLLLLALTKELAGIQEGIFVKKGHISKLCAIYYYEKLNKAKKICRLLTIYKK